jgi:succinate dehydrogenase / fumarate reductase, membrane anchor subunit
VRSGFTGLPAWLVQRMSAVYMLLFLVSMLGALWLHPRPSYTEWRTWVGHPGMSIVIMVFFAALLSHIWVGLRDVLLDYARPAGLRNFLLGALGTSLFATAAWVLWILFRAQN